MSGFGSMILSMGLSFVLMYLMKILGDLKKKKQPRNINVR